MLPDVTVTAPIEIAPISKELIIPPVLLAISTTSAVVELVFEYDWFAILNWAIYFLPL
jgi:hypothetical protein